MYIDSNPWLEITRHFLQFKTINQSHWQMNWKNNLSPSIVSPAINLLKGIETKNYVWTEQIYPSTKIKKISKYFRIVRFDWKVCAVKIIWLRQILLHTDSNMNENYWVYYGSKLKNNLLAGWNKSCRHFNKIFSRYKFFIIF